LSQETGSLPLRLIERLYWALWIVTTTLTGVLAGYMVSHSIMLGRFFNWFIESGNLDLLHRTYTVFREASNAHITYDIPLYLHFAAGVAFVVLAFVLKRHRILSVLAGLSTYWTGSIFMLIDLDEAEDSVLTGTADAAMTQYYLSINIPVHATFAAIYLASMLLLLLIPLLDKRSAVSRSI
jgi:hypothetical protein